MANRIVAVGEAMSLTRVFLLTALATLALAQPLLAAESSGKSSEGGKTTTPQDEDFSNSPFTEYGEFNEISEEETDARFFQYGRFFGVSLGLGFEFIDGNRGALWQGGFPMVDFKVHYWFDFNFALTLGFFTANHFFDTTVQNLFHVDANLLHLGIDLKYYIPTSHFSAPISFANPFLVTGFGSYAKTQNSNTQQTQDQDSSVGVSLGAGLEFAISPKKAYFQLEGKVHIVRFKDTFTTNFRSIGLENLTGNFYTFTGNFLFTW
jgi:hypothetical protein